MAALLLACAVACAPAQSTVRVVPIGQGSVFGRVTDLHSDPAAGASLILRSQATGAEFRSVASRNGSFRFTALPPGEYRLIAHSQKLGYGYLQNVYVRPGAGSRIRAAMRFQPQPVDAPASRAQTSPAADRDLTSSAPATQPTQSSPPPAEQAFQQPGPAAEAVTTTIDATELDSMPVNGRNWEEFIADSPAASTRAGGESATTLRGSIAPAEVAVDGVNTGLAFGPADGPRSAISGDTGDGPNAMGQAWGGRRTPFSQTAIREVRTVAGNVSDGSARGAAGHVTVTTRSGSNDLHGQGYIFDRLNAWGARNPFSQWIRETAPATSSTTPVFTPQPYTPPSHETTFGAGTGGRIRRNKLFWFGAVDGSRRNDPAMPFVRHPDKFFAQPSNDEMQVLSARLGLSSVNPVAEGLGAYSKMLETLAGLLSPAPRTSTQWVGFGRIDWDAGERNAFTLEGMDASWDAPGGGLRGLSEPYGNHSFGSSQASQQWLMGRWQTFITPNLLAVTQASTGHAVLSARPEQPSPFEQTLEQSAWSQLPQIVVDSRYGFTIGNPSRFGQGAYPDERIFSARQLLDWAHGTLLARGGVEFSHNADATALLRNRTGTYHYATVYDFASDALAYGAFGLPGLLNPASPHGCDQTGKVWRDSAGGLRGLGNLPCYSYYTQTMGAPDWHLSTNVGPALPPRNGRPGRRWCFPPAFAGSANRCPHPLPNWPIPIFRWPGRCRAPATNLAPASAWRWVSRKAAGRCCAWVTAFITRARKTPHWRAY